MHLKCGDIVGFFGWIFTGRVFVHEWAHLRWGVFDEYNIDAPFYSTGGKKAEATRYHGKRVILKEVIMLAVASVGGAVWPALGDTSEQG